MKNTIGRAFKGKKNFPLESAGQPDLFLPRETGRRVESMRWYCTPIEVRVLSQIRIGTETRRG